MARFTAQVAAAVILAGATHHGVNGFAGLKPSSKGFALKMVSVAANIGRRQKLPPGGGEPGLEGFFPGFLGVRSRLACLCYFKSLKGI